MRAPRALFALCACLWLLRSTAIAEEPPTSSASETPPAPNAGSSAGESAAPGASPEAAPKPAPAAEANTAAPGDEATAAQPEPQAPSPPAEAVASEPGPKQPPATAASAGATGAVSPKAASLTLSARSSTASDSTPAASDDEPNAESEDEPPWAPWSALLGWTQYYTEAGLLQHPYRTFNPTYAWNFLLAGAYNFDRRTSLALTQLATVELTDADTTAKRQQFLLYDTYVDLSHKIPIKIDAKQGYLLSGVAGLLLPTSKSSQAANMVLGARVRGAAGYRTKSVLHGADVSASAGYIRRFTSTNTVQSESLFPCNVAGRDESQQCTFLGGSTSSRDIVLLGLDGTLHMSEAWSAGVSLTFWFASAQSLAPATIPTDTGPVTFGDQSLTHFRNSRWLLLFATYQFNPWLSATARVTDIFAERGPDGSLRPPFHPLDTLLGVELDVSFDQLYLSQKKPQP